jgi:hypothetical protein
VAKKQRGSARENLLLWIVGGAITLLVIFVLVGVTHILQVADNGSILNHLAKTEQFLYWENSPSSSGESAALSLFDGYVSKSLTLFTVIIGVLFATLILLLGILIYQMYLRSLDLKKIDQWRETGFLCERLEFLPANRILLNNIELELNKTQIESLRKLAHNRVIGKPLHSVDMGDHAVQSIKRLREELGSKFIEKSLVKVRRREGYWLEVDAGGIHGL